MTTPEYRALCAELAGCLDDALTFTVQGDTERSMRQLITRARTLLAAPEVVEAGGDSDVIRALVKAEAALADIGDAEREPGDDLAWCERRAAETLPVVREALAFCSTAHPAPVPVSERLPGVEDMDSEGTCWCWHSVMYTWGLFRFDPTAHSHWLPYWALPWPGDQP